MIQRAVVLYVSYFPVRCCSKSESHMKTKTTEIPFTDYNVNTTGALFLAPILSLTFSQEVIKLQDPESRRFLFVVIFRLRAPSNCLRRFRRKKGSFTRFSTRLGLARSNFYQIINFAKNFHPGDTHATRVTIPIGRPVRIDANCGNSGTEIDNVRNSHFLACHYTFLPWPLAF